MVEDSALSLFLLIIIIRLNGIYFQAAGKILSGGTDNELVAVVHRSGSEPGRRLLSSVLLNVSR